MICTVLRCSHTPFVWPFDLYKPTHINHPCTRWISASECNYLWALEHGLALCHEYTSRYSKTHKCEAYFNGISKLPIPELGYGELVFDPLKLSCASVPQNCKFAVVAIENSIFENCARYNASGQLLAIETYRAYYYHKTFTLKRKMRWYKNDELPPFLQQEENDHKNETQVVEQGQK